MTYWVGALMPLKFNTKNLSDSIMAIAAVVVILMIIVPLPTVLLDLLMAVNLLAALLILLLVIYTPRAIDFSSFPTVLLIITVFGLGLNVSSTRLILTKGTAFDGKMVRAFSSFVVGSGGTEGTLVGFVIFIIIIAVQAMVITKGATRIAEVAARFTLDAMPMKQAAIESEYNQGALTEDEARKKKLELQVESDFYASMDGASKFVSGNVKLGILITVINLVVGLIVGMVFREEDFQTSIGIYASLTIGDGLLSQLPSLLVSFATGLIVARAASDGTTTIGETVKKEFTKSSYIYIVGGALMAILGLLPGFPWYVLIPMGAALIYLGMRLRKTEVNKAKAKEMVANQKKAEGSSPTREVEKNSIAPLDDLSLELGLGLLQLVDKEKGAELLERITRIRRESLLDLGLVVPPIRIIDNMRLEPNEYSFKIKGVEIGKSKIRMGCYMCMDTGGVINKIQGEATVEPAFNLPAIWVTEDKREEAERSGYSVIDPPTIIATHLTELIKKHASEILGRQEVKSMLDALTEKYPAVVEEVTKIFSVGQIQKVLQGLLKEQVSIRNMVVILETISDYGGVTKDTFDLVEKARQALGRQICLQYSDEKNTLHVFTVDPGFISRIVESGVKTVNGPIAALEINEQRSWIAALSGAVNLAGERGYMPVILCPQEARALIKASSERELPQIVVLSIPEIASDIKVEMIGEIRVDT